MEKIQLFDFIKILFTDRKKWNSLNDWQKKSHRFMVTRFMSIKYPTQANMLNKYGLNEVSVMDVWSSMFSEKFVKRTGNKNVPVVPYWIYTKTKAKKVETEETWTPSKETQRKFMEYYQMSSKDWDFSFKINKDLLKKQVLRFEKFTSGIS